jgi:predicted  nucleic acid-binding Zn ribbon protein
MASPDSELSQRGREICQQVEAATGVPTYYFLMRYWGRRKGEETRRCPGCGGSWHVVMPANATSGFCDFPFRCEACRLVSHLGKLFDDPRRAAIGEWKDR